MERGHVPRSSIAVSTACRETPYEAEVQTCARFGVDDVPGLRLSAFVCRQLWVVVRRMNLAASTNFTSSEVDPFGA